MIFSFVFVHHVHQYIIKYEMKFVYLLSNIIKTNFQSNSFTDFKDIFKWVIGAVLNHVFMHETIMKS